MTTKKPKPPHVWVVEVWSHADWFPTLYIERTRKRVQRLLYAVPERTNGFKTRIRKYLRA